MAHGIKNVVRGRTLGVRGDMYGVYINSPSYMENTRMSESPSMLELLQRMRKDIEKMSAIPQSVFIPRQTEHSYTEMAARFSESKGAALGDAINGLRVLVTDLLPKQYECVGHEFCLPVAAKNRSRRLWKKLRYGACGQHIKPILQEMHYALIINEPVLRDDRRDSLLYGFGSTSVNRGISKGYLF